jgi:hypothetical protein
VGLKKAEGKGVSERKQKRKIKLMFFNGKVYKEENRQVDA